MILPSVLRAEEGSFYAALCAVSGASEKNLPISLQIPIYISSKKMYNSPVCLNAHVFSTSRAEN
jgi:hypothetical protein